jgi:hypothetical protein
VREGLGGEGFLGLGYKRGGKASRAEDGGGGQLIRLTCRQRQEGVKGDVQIPRAAIESPRGSPWNHA